MSYSALEKSSTDSANSNNSKALPCPPPRAFLPAGQFSTVQMVEKPLHHRTSKLRTAAAAAGRRYERYAQAYLGKEYGDRYVPSPWFRFDRRLCNPDGLLFVPEEKAIIIVEIKLRHTSDSWWQLRQLYAPVVSCFYKTSATHFWLLELVKWFDPATRYPEKIHRVPFPHLAPANGIGVCIWTPRRA